MQYGFLEAVKELDRLRGRSIPTAADVKRLRDLLSKSENAQYFFTSLDNPSWFPYIRETGYFDNPPEPMRTEEGNYRIPVWNATRYLARMARQFPDEVADIATRYKTTNAWVIHDLLVAAKEMPLQTLAKMTPAFINWLDVPFGVQSGSLTAELMALLSEGGQVDSALQLLEALIEPKIESSKDEQSSQFLRASSRFREYELRDVLLIQVPKVVERQPVRALAVLEKQLEKALDLEVQANHIDNARESSIFWRSAIEDSEQNWQHGDLKNLLTTAVRDILAVLSRGDLPESREVIERYLAHKYSIFRRLAIHMVWTFPDQYSNQLSSLFQAKKNLWDLAIHHEFSLLMKAWFSRLPREIQTQFLKWIEEGPDLTNFQEGSIGFQGRPATEQELEERKNYWIFERLWFLRDSNLPQDYANKLDRLHKKFGEPEHPEFLTYHTSWQGSPSPISENELSGMTVEDLVRKFIEIKVETEHGEPSSEGLARVFQLVVEKNAKEYASHAQAFGDPRLAATYVYHYLIGLHEALKKESIFDWVPVLKLAREVITRADSQWSDRQDRFETSPATVRGAISDLLTAGCSNSSGAIPKELFPDARHILMQLTHDPDPSADEELKQTDMDAATLSINCVRGKAMHAVFVYARYRMKILRLEKADNKLEPEIVKLFEEKLDKTKDAALSVHAVFGWNLPLLYFFDAKWVTENLGRFFPSDHQMKRYRDVAWDAYITFNNLYSDVFELLFLEYRHAAREVNATNKDKVGLDDANNHLAEHLMLAYLYGFPNAKIDEPLLTDFFAGASEETRAHAVWFIWQAMEEDDENKRSEKWMYLKTLWEWRIQKATELKIGPSKELSTFAYCLRVVPEELDDLASLIKRTIPYLTQGGFADEIVEFLKRNAQQYPKLAVDILSQVSVNTPEPRYLTN